VIDVTATRAEFSSGSANYEALVQYVIETLKAALGRGSRCVVDGRSKDWGSFLKKAIRKKYADPLRQIGDRAGVRVVIPDLSYFDEVRQAINGVFRVIKEEDAGARLSPSQLGYLGTHFDVTIMERDRDAPGNLRGLKCEIQVHTIAQHAWSEVAHDLVYKRVVDLPGSLARAIYRLVALAELFDQEIVRVRELVRKDPAFREVLMLEALEPIFFEMVGRDYDRQLSLYSLDALRQAYSDEELSHFVDLMSKFVDANREKVTDVFGRYRDVDEPFVPLLFQPEVLVVFERLRAHRETLRELWDASLPPEALDALSAVWGAPA
jgi:ppGpp synthetase/RelA/SpoT-type nucleotidyltranferase